jgi:hypothetical protein
MDTETLQQQLAALKSQIQFLEEQLKRTTVTATIVESPKPTHPLLAVNVQSSVAPSLPSDSESRSFTRPPSGVYEPIYQSLDDPMAASFLSNGSGMSGLEPLQGAKGSDDNDSHCEELLLRKVNEILQDSNSEDTPVASVNGDEPTSEREFEEERDLVELVDSICRPGDPSLSTIRETGNGMDLNSTSDSSFLDLHYRQDKENALQWRSDLSRAHLRPESARNALPMPKIEYQTMICEEDSIMEVQYSLCYDKKGND